MNRKTRGITLGALFSALSAACLYIASVWPTGQLGFAAFSSLFVAAAIIEIGLVSGIYVFAVSSAIGMLLAPDKAAPLLFVLFFGYYPVVKSLIERIKPPVVMWFLKLLVFNVSLTVIWLFMKVLFFGFLENTPGALLIFLFGNAVFVLFDYGYSKVIQFYLSRISGARGRRSR